MPKTTQNLAIQRNPKKLISSTTTTTTASKRGINPGAENQNVTHHSNGQALQPPKPKRKTFESKSNGLDGHGAARHGTALAWMELLEPTKYWSTVLSQPTSSCVCDTRCTLSLPSTTDPLVLYTFAPNRTHGCSIATAVGHTRLPCSSSSSSSTKAAVKASILPTNMATTIDRQHPNIPIGSSQPATANPKNKKNSKQNRTEQQKSNRALNAGLPRLENEARKGTQ